MHSSNSSIAKTFFLITCLALLPLALLAQNEETSEATVSGTVIDGNGTPLTGATVSINNTAMSEVITGTSTNQDGTFDISLSPGRYVVKVSFVSYGSYQEEIDLKSGEDYSMSTVTLEQSTEELGELYVRGEQSEMEMSFDKRVFRVGKDLTSMGGSAANVLENVPSISTDIDGNISLRGNESVRLLINGKPSNMVSNGVDALRSIPAGMIKEVEIITNPSSKYAAEGSAGVINIILKKDQQLGFNGSVAAGSGYPQNHELSTNLNYRKSKINWFFSGSIDYESEPESGSSFQRFGPDPDYEGSLAPPDTTYMYREQTDAAESEIDGNLRFGADYYLTDTQILTASAFVNLERESNDEDITYTDLQYSQGAFDGNVIERVFRRNEEDGTERDFDFNLEYENIIDGSDHKLTADASFDISRESADTDIRETVQQGTTDPLLQRTTDSEQESDFRFNAEYIRPLFGDGKLEAGLRTDTEWKDNSYRALERQNEVFEPLPAFNDNFLYMENVNSAYAIVGNEFGKFSGQFGLRLENTNIRTEIKNSGDVNEQNYLNLFPSLFLNYSFTEQSSVQLSYSRRLSRPWSRALLPFTDFSDSRSQYTGNPDLTPEYSNSYETGFLQRWGTGSVLTSFYYRYRTDVIERITEQRDGVLRRFPINLATEEAWGVEFSADQELFDGLELSANANFFRSDRDGSYQQQVFTSSAQAFQARSKIRWDIAGAWDYQASLRYRGPRETTQGSRDAQTMMDTGLSREFADGKAILSLSIRDVFNSRNFNNTVTTDGNPVTDFYSQREFSWSSRTFSLNFRYFFGRDSQGGGERGGRGGRGR